MGPKTSFRETRQIAISTSLYIYKVALEAIPEHATVICEVLLFNALGDR